MKTKLILKNVLCGKWIATKTYGGFMIGNKTFSGAGKFTFIFTFMDTDYYTWEVICHKKRRSLYSTYKIISSESTVNGHHETMDNFSNVFKINSQLVNAIMIDGISYYWRKLIQIWRRCFKKIFYEDIKKAHDVFSYVFYISSDKKQMIYTMSNKTPNRDGAIYYKDNRIILNSPNVA